MPRIFDTTQTLITLDNAGLYQDVDMLRAALGWVLQAARETDLLAQRGTELWQVAQAAATSGSDGLAGQAFENAVVDLLTEGRVLLPQLGKAIGLALAYMGVEEDVGELRVIALVTDRTGTLLRTDLATAEAFVADEARLLTPFAGRPVGLRGSSHQRLADLLAASTSRTAPRSLPPTAAMLHHADLLLGWDEGRHWVGVSVRSGDARCTTDQRGVHFGVSELRTESIHDSFYKETYERVPGRGRVVTFVEARIGTAGTPLERIREAVGVLGMLASLRPSSDPSKGQASAAVRQLLAELQPLLTGPVDEALAHLRPWTSGTVSRVNTPAVALEADPGPGVATRLV